MQFLEIVEYQYLAQMTATIFLLFLEKGDFSHKARELYNQQIHDYFDGHRDYIVAHYRSNSRSDTPYWRANADGVDRVSDSLKSIYQTWFEGKDLAADIGPMTGPDVVASLDELMRRCALNFRDHRSVLDSMALPVRAAA